MIQLGVALATPQLADRENYGRLARAMLETVAFVNGTFLEAHPETPALYRAGVLYGGTREDGFRIFDIPAIMLQGQGLCSHLSAWRVAELRRAGERAGFRIVWTPTDPSEFHVLVRRSNGDLEDPSEVLGMTPWPYSL